MMSTQRRAAMLPVPLRPRALGLLFGSALLILAGGAQALDEQWYFGLGISAAALRPDARAPGFDPDEDLVTGGTVFLGRDLDKRSSVQVQLHGLGETAFESGETIDYLAGDTSIIYRLVDSRDFAPLGQQFGASFYGRFGLGLMMRDSDVDLETDGSVYFGGGAGIEVHATRHVAFRAEGTYHETDATSANLSLLMRFGGRSGFPPSASSIALASATNPENRSQPGEPTAPLDQAGNAGTREMAGGDRGSAQPLQTPPGAGDLRGTRGEASVFDTDSDTDSDADGVADSADVCPRSAFGFPVLDNGCALLDGVLSGLRFAPDTADFLPGTQLQLDYLAVLLNEYPLARIELHAHTDNTGTLRDQSILARLRLRALGIYLVQQRGIRSIRLVLRAFGGARPIDDNSTDAGRRRNNRIEVLENAS